MRRHISFGRSGALLPAKASRNFTCALLLSLLGWITAPSIRQHRGLRWRHPPRKSVPVVEERQPPRSRSHHAVQNGQGTYCGLAESSLAVPRIVLAPREPSVSGAASTGPSKSTFPAPHTLRERGQRKHSRIRGLASRIQPVSTSSSCPTLSAFFTARFFERQISVLQESFI